MVSFRQKFVPVHRNADRTSILWNLSGSSNHSSKIRKGRNFPMQKLFVHTLRYLPLDIKSIDFDWYGKDFDDQIDHSFRAANSFIHLQDAFSPRKIEIKNRNENTTVFSFSFNPFNRLVVFSFFFSFNSYFCLKIILHFMGDFFHIYIMSFILIIITLK